VKWAIATVISLFLQNLTADAAVEPAKSSELKAEEESAKGLEKLGVIVRRENGRVTAVQLHLATDLKLEHVRMLRKFSTLSEVEIQAPILTRDAVASLSEFQTLRKLAIRIREETPEESLDLESLRGLKFLDVTGHERLTDERFETLRFPEDLEVVSIFGWKITDRSLRHVQSISNLRRLDLDCPRVTDEGLLELKGAKKMKELFLLDSAVTGSAFADLPWMKQLERMSWSIPPAVSRDQLLRAPTDDRLAKLDRCQRLSWLDLTNGLITDDGVKFILLLKSLTFLNLSNTHVSDDGLAQLATQQGLEHLHLFGCRSITDAGIVHLAKLPRLKVLSVAQTQVTPAAARKIKAALPDLAIDPADLLK
jgi:internalin A